MVCCREHLDLGPRTWALQQRLALAGRGGQADWSGGSGKTASGRTEDLTRAEVKVVAYVNGEPRTQLVLREGEKAEFFFRVGSWGDQEKGPSFRELLPL